MAEPKWMHQGLHCTDCGVIFESINSLQVHVQYHKENLLLKWGTPFPPVSPPSPSMLSLQSQSFAPLPSVNQGKPSDACISSTKYLPVQNSNEHSLSPLPFRGYEDYGNGYLSRPKIDGEPQAEILDLDSHKVHVYQPPEGEKSEAEKSLSPMMLPWYNNKKYYPVNTQGSSEHSNLVLQAPVQPPQQVPATSLNPPLPHTLTSIISQQNGAPKISSPDFTPASSSSLTPPAEPHASFPPQAAYPPSKSSKSGGSWKSNEARRPKTYNCTACNKWFTSSGHLKRHYNTTLHKNAVKQSGVPDPATLPISTHHYPQKDTNFNFKQQQQIQQNNQQQEQQKQQQQADPTGKESFAGNTSNINCTIRSVPEAPRSLFSQQQLPSQFPAPHQTYLPYPYQESMALTQYPNFLPPHVSSTRPDTISRTIGNLAHVNNHFSAKFILNEYVGGLSDSRDKVLISPEASLGNPSGILYLLFLYVLLLGRNVSFFKRWESRSSFFLRFAIYKN